MPLNIKFDAQKALIAFENNKVTISPQKTGETKFALAYVDGDEIPEIIPINLYKNISAERIEITRKIEETDKENSVSYSLIQNETEDEDGDKILSVYSETITFPKPIDKENFNILLDVFLESGLIDEYEKGKLLALNDNERNVKKPNKLTAEQLFLQSLSHIKNQEGILKKKGETGASKAAHNLHRDLTYAYDKFKDNMLKMPFIASIEEKKKPFLDFQNSCDTAIQEAKETLGSYWNWKTIFLNIGVAIATVGLVHLALALTPGKSPVLFKPYADGSVEKELNVEELKTNYSKLDK